MIQRRVACVLAALLAAGLLGAIGQAQESSPARLQALVVPFFTKLTQIRGLALPPPPPVVSRSRDEIRRYFQERVDLKQPVVRVEAERKAMVAWRLIPADFDLRGFLLDLLQEQAAAYYDPGQKVMVLADWIKPEEQQIALVHELVHALQDRELPLEQFLTPVPGKGDQLLARQALVEGEAVALSLEFLLQAQGLELARIPSLSGLQQLATTLSAGPVYARAPKFLQDLLLFPYVQGLVFIHQFKLRHPWAALSQLYRDPPRSTAQILHPEKLFDRREDPLPVPLGDSGPILAPPWRRVSEDELGEWGLGAALARFLGEAAASRLAPGWRGDRYQVWEDGRGQLALIYRVRWEAEGPAEAFAQAYAGLLEKKHPALAGRAVKAPGSLWSWQEGQNSFVVERRGLDVLVLEGVPTSAETPLRQLLWAAGPSG
jgi:hypothetical protein